MKGGFSSFQHLFHLIDLGALGLRLVTNTKRIEKALEVGVRQPRGLVVGLHQQYFLLGFNQQKWGVKQQTLG